MLLLKAYVARRVHTCAWREECASVTGNERRTSLQLEVLNSHKCIEGCTIQGARLQACVE